MDKVLNITYTSSLTNLCEINTSFDTGVLRVCYTGKNRNGSFFSKEDIQRNIKTIYNCPIVCNYDRETDIFGGHDIEVVSNDDGDLRLVNLTTPVGVVPESAKVWFEDFTEDDGTVHEYLYTEVLLWKRQEAYKKIKDDGITAHSMEIQVKDGELIDDVYHVKDFEFTAFALIGVEPCFESSSLEVFSNKEFKQQLSEMMQDLKETYTMVKTSNEDDEINSNNYSVEGGKEILEEKIKLAKEYNIDVDSLDFSLEDFTIEELTEKFDAIKSTAVPAKNNKPTVNESEDKFALTQNIVSELRRVLDDGEKFTTDWDEDYPKYSYIDCDIETKEVYCWDIEDGIMYGFAFEMNGDNINIDFSSKKRKKVAFVDFEEGEEPPQTPEVFSKIKESVSNVCADCKNIKAKFSDASKSIDEMSSELDELRKFKSDIEEQEKTKQREDVFAKFEDLEGIEAFEVLKQNCAEYDLNTLEEKCFAIRGRNATVAKFSVSDKTPKLKVGIIDEDPDEPYGGIVKKYTKN